MRPHIALALALTVIGLWAQGLEAQYHPGDGRALDRNLQQGSGGVNAAAPQPDFRARNDLITGNVPGLGYFHGNVGYGAPNAFGDRLADDALFRFRAQSIPQLSTGPGPGSGYLSPVAPGQPTMSVYSPFSATTGQDIRLGSYNVVPQMPWLAVRVEDRRPSLVQESLSLGLPMSQTVGYLSQSNGQTLELNASPLFGLRRRVLGESGPAPAGPPTVQPDQGLIDGQVDPATGKVKGDAPTDQARGDTSMLMAPSLELGLQIEARADPKRSSLSVNALEERVARLQTAMFRPLTTKVLKPSDDAYLDLLAKVKQQAEALSGAASPATPGAATPDTGAAGLPKLEAPSAEKLAAAETARLRAMRAARGLPVEDGAASPPGAAATKVGDLRPRTVALLQAAGVIEADRVALSGKLRELVGTIDYRLPRVPSLAGAREDRLNQLLRQAEEDLAAGRYFDAESRYHQVLGVNPGQVMARVGLIHAQMGAGLIRSAAGNLRRLFDEHPELIAAQYDAKVLPSAERLKWVRAEIEDVIISTASRQEPVVLLAYLGYQTGTRELTQYGLDLAQARAPNDPLIPLLRRIWLRPAPTPAQGTVK